LQAFDFGDETNEKLRELFGLYAKARRGLVVGEGLIGEVILPCVNEIRNGWDDVWQILNGLASPGSEAAKGFLADAGRHFRRATSEVFEAVLIVRLSELCDILQSLRDSKEYRVVKSRYYAALQNAFDRGRVALANAKDSKHQTPDTATQAAKEGIALVQSAIDAFMLKVGEFDLAQEVRKISDGQKKDRHFSLKALLLQIALAFALFFLSFFLGRASSPASSVLNSTSQTAPNHSTEPATKPASDPRP